MGCIILNTIIMSIRHARMSETYEKVLEILNYIFAFIFNVECALKLTGLSFAYFKSSWNKFDFFIVVGTNAGILS